MAYFALRFYTLLITLYFLHNLFVVTSILSTPLGVCLHFSPHFKQNP